MDERSGVIVLHVGKNPMQHRAVYRDHDGAEHLIDNVCAATIQVNAASHATMTLDCFVVGEMDIEIKESFARIREHEIGLIPGLRASGV